MGTEMIAFVEYSYVPAEFAKPPPPFDPDLTDIRSVSRGEIYVGSKDYHFFSAVAGVRAEDGEVPMFPPRGMPPAVSREVEQALNSHGELGDHNSSWLRLSEVEAALAARSLTREDLGFETVTLLALMKGLVLRLGDERVRVVFGFDG